VAGDVREALDAVLDTLERIAKVLPTLKVYVDLYNSSKLQLLREPLVRIYADIISFGLRAVKLLNRSKFREFNFRRISCETTEGSRNDILFNWEIAQG
jgi:hypothetical protein